MLPDGSAPGIPEAFPDVPASHPFTTDIAWLVRKGIATGYADGTFKPGTTVSRQAIAVWLHGVAGKPRGADPSCAAAPFPDVARSHPYCGEIAWAAESGLVHGYASGHFRPTAAVSRQALVAFVYRLAGSPRGADPGCIGAAYVDVPANHPFCGEIRWADDTGLVNGYSDGTFRPTDPVTRQAAAAVLHRYGLR